MWHKEISNFEKAKESSNSLLYNPKALLWWHGKITNRLPKYNHTGSRLKLTEELFIIMMELLGE